MNADTSPMLPQAGSDFSLGDVLAKLASCSDKPLIFEYGGHQVQAGYHVTEVKAGSFVTLDCGGNPDAWQETILQVEDIPARPGEPPMNVSTFRSILAEVGRKVQLNTDARLTIEVSRPEAPMQIFDVAEIAIDQMSAIIRLVARPAICKPRHRAERSETKPYCAPARSNSRNICCA